ncbi:MAG: hypothetical protein ACHRHE_07995 [Tepidisphaerales bacterium]
MLKPVNSIKLAALALAGAAAIALAVVGCASSPESSGGSSPTSRPAAGDAKPAIGHAELWARTCNRCHNALSPDQYSAQQWEAVLAHMRFRGGLSEEEHKVILDFLQASR